MLILLWWTLRPLAELGPGELTVVFDDMNDNTAHVDITADTQHPAPFHLKLSTPIQ